MLQEELNLYGAGLTEKPALLVANKADLVPEAPQVATDLEAVTGLPVVLVSAQNCSGIDVLKTLLRQLSPTDIPL